MISDSIVFPIDIPTLALSRGIVQMMLGGLLLYLGTRHEDARGARWWAFGFLINGLSLFVFPLQIPEEWERARTVLNHLAVGVSSLCLLLGFWIFGQQTRRHWILFALIALPVTSLVAWEVLWPNTRWRVLTTASAQTLFLLALQHSLGAAPRAELSRMYRRLRYVVWAYLLVFVWSYASIADLLPTAARSDPGYHRSLFSVASLLFMLSLAVGCLALQFGLMAARNADLAMIDWLTGLLNRRGFFHAARDQVDQAKPVALHPALIAIDVDHFKRINDRHGHAAGDQVLQALAVQIKQLIGSGSLAARMGGEEFLILLPDAEPAAALALAETLRARCAALTMHGKHNVAFHFTVSAGVYAEQAVQSDDHWLESALLRADDALYEAKHGGRDRVEAYAPTEPAALNT